MVCTFLSFVEYFRTAFKGPFGYHDAHSVADAENWMGTRPYDFLGLAAFLNHSCEEHANFEADEGFFEPVQCTPHNASGASSLVRSCL